MKKTFIKLMFCSLLAVASTTFVGCKDYDDDIQTQQEAINQLSSQLTALQTALNNAQADATAAKQAADKATAAAATAKAEAIQEVIDQLRPLINANTAQITENANQISAILGRIDGIDSSLRNVELKVDGNTASIEKLQTEVGNLKTSVSTNTEAIQELSRQMEAANVQIAALNTFKESASDRLDKIEDAIKDLETIRDNASKALEQAMQNKADIADLSEQVGKNTSAITDLTGRVSDIETAVNTLAATFSHRLTSVTLIPDLYVDGIPTIAFKSAAYYALDFQNGEWVATEKQEIVTNGTATAEYRLNPSILTLDDIDAANLSYVAKVATSRVESELVKVIEGSPVIGKDGVLTVKLGKTDTGSLMLGGDQINTVALRVPIAAKRLVEGEAEGTAVYSEYTRLEETTFAPRLSFYGEVYDNTLYQHLYKLADAKAAARGDLVAATVAYNKTDFDLYTLVEGCEYSEEEDHPLLTRDELKAYGLDIEFSIPTAENEGEMFYALDGVDQQRFATVENGIFKPNTAVIYGQEGVAGKEPIVLAKLVNTTTQAVVDAKYFKIKIGESPEQEFGPFDFTASATTACNDATSFVVTMTWKEFEENVLSKFKNDNEQGISRADFIATYDNVLKDDAAVRFITDTYGDDDPAIIWSYKADPTKVGENKFSSDQTITFTDNSKVNGNVVVKLHLDATVTLTLATLGETYGSYYEDGVLKVYPVPMNQPYDGETATYKTNILQSRYNDAYIVGLADCDLADIDYAENAGLAYVGEDLEYVQLGHWQITKANQSSLKAINYSLKEKDENAELLIKNGSVITLDWKQRFNGLSSLEYTFAQTKLKIVPILTLNSQASESITDNSRKVYVDLTKVFSMQDAYGNRVANDPNDQLASDYYQFYNVDTPTFEGTIFVADDEKGTNPVSLELLNMEAIVDADGTLSYQNNGASLLKDCYLIVPIQVKHKWGTTDKTRLSGTIAVPLKKSSAPLNKRNK